MLKLKPIAIGLLTLTATLSSSAFAAGLVCTLVPALCGPTGGGGVTSAPEIDPASAAAALTLLAGGLAALRGRRASKKKDA